MNLDRARRLLDAVGNVHVFTGAGMSADSGLATYRDEDSGIWKDVDPIAMASVDAWEKDPEKTWRWYAWRAELVGRAEPNAGHLALARSARALTVTTQNIDNLHERAGSEGVVHLHGSLFDHRCGFCGAPHRGEVSHKAVPRCQACGGLVRPGVVWFGEPLPPRQWAEAERRMRAADAVIIVGTSGVVFPAAGLPLIAHRRGIPLIEVTPQPTELTELATETLIGTAAEVLPHLV